MASEEWCIEQPKVIFFLHYKGTCNEQPACVKAKNELGRIVKSGSSPHATWRQLTSANVGSPPGLLSVERVFTIAEYHWNALQRIKERAGIWSNDMMTHRNIIRPCVELQ